MIDAYVAQLLKEFHFPIHIGKNDHKMKYTKSLL